MKKTERYTVVKGEAFEHYVEFEDPWFRFCHESTTYQGKKRVTVGVELHKEGVESLFNWMLSVRKD